MKRLMRGVAWSVLVAMGFLGCSGEQVKETQHEAMHRYKMVEVSGRHYSPEVLWNFGRLGESSVSPNGAKVAYVVTYYDMQDNRGWSELYVSEVGGDGSARRVNLPTEDVLNVLWLNDDMLAFVSSYDNEEKGGALYSVPL